MSMTPPPPRGVVPGRFEAIADGAPATAAYLHAIGDIGVTRTLVVTPVGTCALRGSNWALVDHTEVRRVVPLWAKVCAAVLIVAVVGAVFLMVRRTEVSGHIEITVDGGCITFTTRVPITSPEARDAVEHEFDAIRRLAE